MPFVKAPNIPAEEENWMNKQKWNVDKNLINQANEDIDGH